MKSRRAGRLNRSRSRGQSKPAPAGRAACSRGRRLGLELLEDRRLLDAATGQLAIELFDTSPALFVENPGQWEDASAPYAVEGSQPNVLDTADAQVTVKDDDSPF